jgi:hypothetical protein
MAIKGEAQVLKQDRQLFNRALRLIQTLPENSYHKAGLLATASRINRGETDAPSVQSLLNAAQNEGYLIEDQAEQNRRARRVSRAVLPYY